MRFVLLSLTPVFCPTLLSGRGRRSRIVVPGHAGELLHLLEPSQHENRFFARLDTSHEFLHRRSYGVLVAVQQSSEDGLCCAGSKACQWGSSRPVEGLSGLPPADAATRCQNWSKSSSAALPITLLVAPGSIRWEVLPGAAGAAPSGADKGFKLVVRLASGKQVETVAIVHTAPSGTQGRITVCVSSQVGCKMGCTFCATGTMGFQDDLSAGEILEQVRCTSS